ncbi:MAG: FAD:protein FMN transferase [Sedimentisphaerales bacterium]|nr:FAD:protein FMN transferase [Sedimentisphaerales bacterium]
MYKKEKIFIVISLVAISVLVYSFLKTQRHGFAPMQRLKADSGQRIVMGTFAHVVAVAGDLETAGKCIEAAFTEIENVDALMSGHKSDSQICAVNRDGAKRAVKVSEPTYKVLDRSIEFSKLTGGAFDITVGPLVDLWHAAGEANSLSDVNTITQARSKVGYEKLILDVNERTVRFAAEGMKLDLGGIAKGYAIDKAVEAMKLAGAAGGIVDVGGDIRCFGRPSEVKKYWLIGLQDPWKAQNNIISKDYILVLRLTDAAVATSGHYRRYAVIGGKRYSHIIDSKTASSSEKLASVTVICKNAVDADGLATAVSVMGREKGLALIEQIPDAEAILITPAPEFKRIQSSRAAQYIE